MKYLLCILAAMSMGCVATTNPIDHCEESTMEVTTHEKRLIVPYDTLDLTTGYVDKECHARFFVTARYLRPDSALATTPPPIVVHFGNTVPFTQGWSASEVTMGNSAEGNYFMYSRSEGVKNLNPELIKVYALVTLAPTGDPGDSVEVTAKITYKKR